MKERYKRLPATFAPETRFEKKPLAARLAEAERLLALKNQLLAERLENDYRTPEVLEVRRAASDAEALAWVTPYPSLVFPVLFAEKADAALRHSERQEQVRQRSRSLLAV
jgi:hypothetical protein